MPSPYALPPQYVVLNVRLMHESSDATLDVLVFVEHAPTPKRVRIPKVSERLGLWKDKQPGDEFDVSVPIGVARGAKLLPDED